MFAAEKIVGKVIVFDCNGEVYWRNPVDGLHGHSCGNVQRAICIVALAGVRSVRKTESKKPEVNHE